MTATAEGEVVDPEHAYRPDRRFWQSLGQPQQGLTAHVTTTDVASRTPARPARASPICVSRPRSSGVKRLCGLVRPLTCSTNVTAGQVLTSTSISSLTGTICAAFSAIATM